MRRDNVLITLAEGAELGRPDGRRYGMVWTREFKLEWQDGIQWAVLPDGDSFPASSITALCHCKPPYDKEYDILIVEGDKADNTGASMPSG